ncbi:Kynureninase 1 [Endocarpon pusillum Z07020]|uniref:Kynureninase n=1 Tax=Endocarpon pusillum (strain Z07020 / HMAS-L-300199) TaxID=1263415 RepID=U1HKM7_ENDPU|nr:Kynureninase 1 [Endocarpon pusillum Z07020]ERF69509.1 Kynureninase 1 [Endocarpon pusillum Z07020]
MGSRHHVEQIKHGPPLAADVDIRANSRGYAESLDAHDPLRNFRHEFIIPSKADLKRPTLSSTDPQEAHSPPSIYLCGNSLGLQPRKTQQRVSSFLTAWSTKGVTGHFRNHSDSALPPFVDVDDYAAKLMAPIVGAREDEVAVMGTLTSNLHLVMAGFYQPTREKYKIILEGKSFPSDHYAVESQISQHGFDAKDAMIMIEPQDDKAIITTEQILETIDIHADRTALILLPGIQFYTGQYLDIATITRHAHSKEILIGWDCAHAAGNVGLRLHDWDVDFAVWCNYKYLNSGPGSIGALFVHEKHGRVDMSASTREERYRPRLCGWWGADKQTRFEMDKKFVPRPGAAGYQLSNPSILDLTACIASLEVFHMTSMAELRRKSISLTKYLESLLLRFPIDALPEDKPFTILTPKNSDERGAQLSVRLEPGLLGVILKELDSNGVVVDERKPDVVRIAPAPLSLSESRQAA